MRIGNTRKILKRRTPFRAPSRLQAFGELIVEKPSSLVDKEFDEEWIKAAEKTSQSHGTGSSLSTVTLSST